MIMLLFEVRSAQKQLEKLLRPKNFLFLFNYFYAICFLFAFFLVLTIIELFLNTRNPASERANICSVSFSYIVSFPEAALRGCGAALFAFSVCTCVHIANVTVFSCQLFSLNNSAVDRFTVNSILSWAPFTGSLRSWKKWNGEGVVRSVQDKNHGPMCFWQPSLRATA